jgi:hypothetical protein
MRRYVLGGRGRENIDPYYDEIAGIWPGGDAGAAPVKMAAALV